MILMFTGTLNAGASVGRVGAVLSAPCRVKSLRVECAQAAAAGPYVWTVGRCWGNQAPAAADDFAWRYGQASGGDTNVRCFAPWSSGMEEEIQVDGSQMGLWLTNAGIGQLWYTVAIELEYIDPATRLPMETVQEIGVVGRIALGEAPPTGGGLPRATTAQVG